MDKVEYSLSAQLSQRLDTCWGKLVDKHAAAVAVLLHHSQTGLRQREPRENLQVDEIGHRPVRTSHVHLDKYIYTYQIEN